MELPFPTNDPNKNTLKKPISPMKEMVAYEALWRIKKTSFKTLAALFASQPGKLPSDFVPAEYIEQLYPEVKAAALNPSMAGQLDYLSSRSVAIVGTRK